MEYLRRNNGKTAYFLASIIPCSWGEKSRKREKKNPTPPRNEPWSCGNERIIEPLREQRLITCQYFEKGVLRVLVFYWFVWIIRAPYIIFIKIMIYQSHQKPHLRFVKSNGV